MAGRFTEGREESFVMALGRSIASRSLPPRLDDLDLKLYGLRRKETNGLGFLGQKQNCRQVMYNRSQCWRWVLNMMFR